MTNIQFKELPKIGSRGLAIPYKHYDGKWHFKAPVARYMIKHRIVECWFQCFDSTGNWEWFHGIVALENGRARIPQIG